MKKNYITPYEGMLLARLAYSELGEIREHSEEIPTYWTIDKRYPNANAKYCITAMVAKSDIKRVAVLAVRGSYTVENFFADAQLMAGKSKEVYNMVRSLCVIFKEHLLPNCRGNHWRFVMVGHSLGGFLANLVALKLRNDYVSLQCKGMAFDAPGVANYYRRNDFFNCFDQKEAGHHVINYISSLHSVNTCQPHLGRVIQMGLPRYKEVMDLEGLSQALPEGVKRPTMLGSLKGSFDLAKGSFEGSLEVGKRVLNEVIAPILSHSLLLQGRRLLWWHATENLVLAMNPRTGYPLRSKEIVKMPTLREGLTRRVGGALLASLFGLDEKALEKRVGYASGSSIEDYNQGSIDYLFSPHMMYVSCFALASVALCYSFFQDESEENLHSVWVNLIWVVSTLIQQLSSNAVDQTVRNRQHIATMSVCRRSMDEDALEEKHKVMCDQLTTLSAQSNSWLRKKGDWYRNSSLGKIASSPALSVLIPLLAYAVSEWAAVPVFATILALNIPALRATGRNLKIEHSIAAFYRGKGAFSKNLLLGKLCCFDPDDRATQGMSSMSALFPLKAVLKQ